MTKFQSSNNHQLPNDRNAARCRLQFWKFGHWSLFGNWLLMIGYCSLGFFVPSAFALEARAVKTATDKAGNWLIEQYDPKEKVFGKGEAAKDVETVALAILALCNSPRDYKEANGPYISEPAKFILSELNEDGTFKNAAKNGTIAVPRVIKALEALRNEKYKALTEKLRTKQFVLHLDKSRPDEIKAERASMLRAYFYSDQMAKGKELEEFAEKIMKLQAKDGSFGDDIQVNALALMALTKCYKTLNK